MKRQTGKHIVGKMTVIIGTFFFAGLLLAFILGTARVENSKTAEETRITREAVERAAVLCYAIEGYYPPGLSYIEANYGVEVDHSRFIVEYNIFASNIMPSITIVEKA